MSYESKVTFTISMETKNVKTGEPITQTLLAKNVGAGDAFYKLQDRTRDNERTKTILRNMVVSAKKHGEAFAVFYHPYCTRFSFYVSAIEQMA